MSAPNIPNTEADFWSRVGAPTPTGCREWTGFVNQRGYGMMAWRGRNGHLAHRLAWELTHGPISPGLFVCHRCDNPSCCNPEHLFLGTVADNNRDMMEKGRNVTLRGERNGRAKLTREQVLRLREAKSRGEPIWQIGKDFGVSKSTAYAAARGEFWSHV